MRSDKREESKSISGAISYSRAAALVLFGLYFYVFTYWFANVIHMLTPGVVLLCFLLAWGSLKVSANWIILGEVAVLLATYGWQSPRIGLIPSLWLCYVGLLLFVFRAKYSSMHKALWFDIRALWTDQTIVAPKYTARLLLGIVYSLVSAAGLIAAGFSLLTYSPFGGGGEAWVNWSLAKNEAMWPGALLVSLLIGAVVLLREWNMRQMDPSQAALYVRADRMNWQYRELSRVVRLMLRDRKNRRG
jgi:hypothetical protein